MPCCHPRVYLQYNPGTPPSARKRANLTMSAFWIFGIILNVTLTALAIYWVVKQMRHRDDKRDE
jgi:hypothetical protein